ncbi:protein-L-isoaspartate(D-aspartate) O-methyltransferase [Oxalobacteraceae bacterium R-40]|uniref:Protein-L-isoaspartate O-methyltransferase n=1 Tax=Keguizhuia sedimenti TaxID=3064264 RepID=A0ABU1BQ35_9BURK|nr:protein-L-isoaspartate(D-aspartate) O-methyltransferase [Oxalobacteraceae bacterium R-40]
MTEKTRRFPLPLSSVANKAHGEKKGLSQQKTVMPQTATRNAATNSSLATSRPIRKELGAVPVKAARQIESSSSTMVSHAVRKAMVERVASQGVKDAKVLKALENVPRHLFLEPALASQAYIDASLPIGHHQTISQPYIVARMIEVLRDNMQGGTLERVLEIGTGCGYQAAVLSQVAKDVYSIERIKALHELAKSNLRPLRIPNIRLHYGDGMLGFPQIAPFDGIILAAAGLEVPKDLLEQMAIGGRLVAPVGSSSQVLQLIERKSRHEWVTTNLENCHFVPLRPGTIA